MSEDIFLKQILYYHMYGEMINNNILLLLKKKYDLNFCL